jgi:hypothetical protein
VLAGATGAAGSLLVKLAVAQAGHTSTGTLGKSSA